MITVAQAAHWFDLTKFYQEVKRVSNGNEGIIAIWAYGMHKINPEIDMVSEKLTVGGEILGNYWPKETIYVKQDYKTILLDNFTSSTKEPRLARIYQIDMF